MNINRNTQKLHGEVISATINKYRRIAADISNYRQRSADANNNQQIREMPSNTNLVNHIKKYRNKCQQKATTNSNKRPYISHINKYPTA